MSWKLLDKPKTQKVTKSLAKQFAEMEPAPHDRPLSERRLTVYSKLLNAGQFRPVTWASAICTETGDLYRVNGKHTSVLLSGLDKMPEFFVTIEEYECDTLEDVAKLYATFDSQMQSRSAADIYLSFAATIPALKDVSSQIIKLSVNALAHEQWLFEANVSHNAAERAELILDEVDFTIWLAQIFAKNEGGKYHQNAIKLRRVPVVGAMVRNYHKAQKAATDFWCAVRDETGAKPECPDRKLARYLVQAGVLSGSRGRVIKSTPREMFVKSLHAWNAWRKGETTNLNYYPEAKIPAVL